MQKVVPSNDNTMHQDTPLRELLNSRSREVTNLNTNNLNENSGAKDDFVPELDNSISNIVTQNATEQEKLTYEKSSRKGSPHDVNNEKPYEDNTAIINSQMLIEL